MLEFKKLKREEISSLIHYFQNQTTGLSDYSAGFAYMWCEYAQTTYAISHNCLVLCDCYSGQYYFNYPLSSNGDVGEQECAIEEIEQYCRQKGISLCFKAVTAEQLPVLIARYGSDVHIVNNRRWRDYVYTAEQFKTYAGKRLSGQRNHVNKFKKSNPEWSFSAYAKKDYEQVLAFLQEYSSVQVGKGDAMADAEMRAAIDLLPHLEELHLSAGILRSDEQIVAFSVGELCADTAVIHIEKASRGVSGAYPTVAQLFAQTFCNSRVQWINREDDSGVPGLRKSKMQYYPVRIADKFRVRPNRAIDSLEEFPELHSERLVLKKIEPKDASDFARLACDPLSDRFWDYNWRKYAPSDHPECTWFLQDVYKDFEQKQEIPLGIYVGDTLVGEAVLHNFGYSAQAEIGMRILPEHRRNGYASESLEALMQYGFCELGLERIEAKCHRENEASRASLLKVGMKPCGEDETFFYFYKTAQM